MVFCVDFGVIPTLVFWSYSGYFEVIPTLGIGVIPTLWYFGVIPSLVFCLDFGVILTLWYFV